MRRLHLSLFGNGTKNGFTLIELLLVITVIGSLTALGVASYSSFNNGQSLSSTASDIASLLNAAKSRAVSQVVPTSCTGSLSGYEVDPKKPSAGEVTLYADCGSQVAIATNKLPNGVTFTSAPAIKFAVLSGIVANQAQIVISFHGNSKTVTVDDSGNITIQ